MSCWHKIRLWILGIATVLGLCMGPVDIPPEIAVGDTLSTVLLVASGIMVALIPILILFVISIQRINPFSASQWPYPTQGSNPFKFSEPLNFFHFAGFLFLATGVGVVITGLWHGLPNFLSGSYGIISGLAVLVGVRLCTRVFRAKIAPGVRV